MAKQFEFRLIDGSAPAGQLEADDLIALVQSLKEVATKLGRDETEAELIGRPTKRTQRLAKLNVGLESGSTRVLLQRTAAGDDALDFDLDEERSFDERFEALVSSIAVDTRPDWVSGPLSIAAGKLRAALAHAAPQVEFTVDGDVQTRFATEETHKQTWLADDNSDEETVHFVGRLRVANLDTHRFQVTDDVGNRVALVDVEEDELAGRLLGGYVAVVGSPERDAKGRLSHIHQPVIQAAPAPAGAAGARDAVPLDEILARADGPHAGGISDLTEDEAAAFLEAIGR
ncbi:hypothetical protein JF531_09330 [Microbacterium esteraromaticum]|uniref:hypothetical protein n=1 Tax=Microbacterium esteraromaticum TaxID=57043 RepID=UPI001A8F14E5|nr:hypothetical protein [Microbacterium esteraromaticum]MBN8424721.1 hypothetical protein [Microbacterium esteraromaticum]